MPEERERAQPVVGRKTSEFTLFLKWLEGYFCMNFELKFGNFLRNLMIVITRTRELAQTRACVLLELIVKGANGLSLRDFFVARNRLLR